MCLTALATSLLLAGVTIVALFYGVGGYFVDLALKRGTDSDPMAPPAVSASLTEPRANKPDKPSVEAQAWEIRAQDGINLSATCFIPWQASAAGHQWVILLHGYGRSQEDTWDYAEAYLEHGYQVLTPDLRASGHSQGQYVTMGTMEAEDVALWVGRILSADPKARVVLHGISMGAATAMMTAGRGDMEGKVAAVVEDSGYTSADAMFAVKMEAFQLPVDILLPVVTYMSEKRTGVSIERASALQAVRRSKVPILFIHGTNDLLVPYSMMQTLYAASASRNKEAWTVDGGRHAAAKHKNPEEYFHRVFSFADKYTGNDR
ncbi:alpha/beta hydrolase [Selenomonas sp. TAMA-11512]|uniref:alpha/beta hydrolase n=1 Tax=Selenomonas sp. TAMA-11512 TaxID=3095337 RepID=UPI00308FFA0F|nr:alpha/beta hydrolase [Selenomonas sp. TAMA-11512]